MQHSLLVTNLISSVCVVVRGKSLVVSVTKLVSTSATVVVTSEASLAVSFLSTSSLLLLRILSPGVTAAAPSLMSSLLSLLSSCAAWLLTLDSTLITVNPTSFSSFSAFLSELTYNELSIQYCVNYNVFLLI